jgi:hypothetical protein
MALFFGRAFLHASDTFEQVGYALIVAAMLYMLFQLFAGRPRRVPANADLNARTALHKSELEREREFHGGYGFWSRLVIMMPGLILLCVDSMIAHPFTTHRKIVLLALFLVFSALSIPNNLIRARSYTRQLYDLDSLELESATREPGPRLTKMRVSRCHRMDKQIEHNFVQDLFRLACRPHSPITS